MTRLLTLSLVAALVTAGCDSTVSPRDGFDQLSQDPAALVGTWDWQCDASFWSGGRCDPSEVDATEVLVFGNDGSLTITREGDTVEATTYEVRSRGGRATLDAGTFGSYNFGVDDQRLVLFVEGLADGPERLFLRR